LELNLEKKKTFFAYRTTRSTFGPPAEAGLLPPARLPPLSPVRRARRTRPRQEPHALWPPCTGADEHMDVRWPLHPTRSLTPAVSRPPPPVPSHLPPFAFPQQQAAEWLHSATAAPLLVGVGRSGHHSSPPEPPSSSEHLFLVVQPELASARSGTALAAVIARRSSSRVHRRELLRGLLPSAPPLLFPVHAFRSPCSREARAPSLAPHRGRSWQPAGEQSRRSAIPTSELPPKLPHLWELARWMRLGAESTLVPSPSPEVSPAVSLPPVSGRTCSAHWRVGPVSALGPRVSRSRQAWGARPRVYPTFVAAVFKGIFEK
jgi:hypothetical protein